MALRSYISLGFVSPSTDATRRFDPTYIFRCATLVALHISLHPDITYNLSGDRAIADGRLMAKLYYRGMAEENGKPKVGRSARLLGVRLGIDIDVEQMPRNWLDEQGFLRNDWEKV